MRFLSAAKLLIVFSVLSGSLNAEAQYPRPHHPHYPGHPGYTQSFPHYPIRFFANPVPGATCQLGTVMQPYGRVGFNGGYILLSEFGVGTDCPLRAQYQKVYFVGRPQRDGCNVIRYQGSRVIYRPGYRPMFDPNFTVQISDNRGNRCPTLVALPQFSLTENSNGQVMVYSSRP